MADLPRDDRADEQLSILPLTVHRRLLLVIGVVLAGMDLSRLTGLWPCDIACQGGAHYQTLFGVSVVWPALAAHVVLTSLAWHDVRQGRANLWTVRLMHVLFGTSVFFLLIANALDLSCAYCQAVHWLTILGFLLVLPYSTRRVSLWLPIAGWLIMNALFHHTPVADVAATPGPTPATVDVDLTAAANRGRMYGDPSAARTLEVVVDLTCRHCAEQYRPLMAHLQPAIAAKRVRVVVRHLVRPSQSASTPAAELALAAAVLGEHAAAMEVLLGSNPEAGVAGLQARLGEVIDAVKLDAVFATQRTALAALLADDQQRITLLGVGPRTPSAVLLEDGKVTKRWAGELPVSSIAMALDGAL
jgi:protein-disulfide isomerase